MERRRIAVGLAAIATVAIAVPAIAGPDAGISVGKKIKKAIKKEVARQIEPGPAGPPGEDGAPGVRGPIGPRGPSNGNLDSVLGPVAAPNTLTPLDPDADVPPAATSMFIAKLEAESGAGNSNVRCDLILDPPSGADVVLDTLTVDLPAGNQRGVLSLLGGGSNPSTTANSSAEIHCSDNSTGASLSNIKLGVIRVGDLDS